jgi:hypothetical protein
MNWQFAMGELETWDRPIDFFFTPFIEREEMCETCRFAMVHLSGASRYQTPCDFSSQFSTNHPIDEEKPSEMVNRFSKNDRWEIAALLCYYPKNMPE